MSEQIQVDDGLGTLTKVAREENVDVNQLLETMVGMVKEGDKEKYQFLARHDDNKRKLTERRFDTIQYHTRKRDEITSELFTEFVKEGRKRRLFGFSRKPIKEEAFKKASDLATEHVAKGQAMSRREMDHALRTYFSELPESYKEVLA